MDFNNSQDNYQQTDNGQQGAPQQETPQFSAQQPNNGFETNPYGTAPYVQYVQSVQANPNNGMAIGALVCGIVSILLCCCCGIGAVVAIVGIVLAVLSKKANGGKMSGMAVAGLVCSIIGVVFSAGYIIYYFVGGGAALAAEMLQDMGYYF